MDGYLFFDDVSPAIRDALFELVEEELLSVAAVSISGSAGAFVSYSAGDVRTAYATVEAVADAVGRPTQRLLAVSPRVEMGAPRPGHRPIAAEAAVALALLPVPLSRAEEVAHVAVRVAGEDRVGVAVVIGGRGSVLVEVDGTDLEDLELRLADVLAVAGVAEADVMITGGALGRGWSAPAHDHDETDRGGHHDQHEQQQVEQGESGEQGEPATVSNGLYRRT